MGIIIAGWECNSEMADAITEELKSGLSARGDATQPLLRSEDTLKWIQAIKNGSKPFNRCWIKSGYTLSTPLSLCRWMAEPTKAIM